MNSALKFLKKVPKQPFNLILKLFGLRSFSEVKKLKSIKFLVFDKLILVATLCLWTFFIVFQIRQQITLDDDIEIKEKFLFNLWMNSYTLQNILATVIVLSSLFFHKKVERLSNILTEHDKKVLRLRWNLRSADELEKTAMFMFLINVFAVTVYATAYLINRKPTDEFVDLKDVFNAFNDCYVLLFYVAISKQFIITVFGIHDRLVVLKTNLR